MIDLHVHLAGSIKPITIIEYAKERNVPLPTYNAAELESYLEAPDHCQEAAEFYELCDITSWVLQERRAIRRAMSEMVRELDSQGVMYAEIRFSPSECTLGGLRQGDAIESALEGLKRGMQESRRIRANLVLCIIPEMDEHESFETIVETKKHLRQGVCGLDLLLDESLCQTDYYDWLFKLMKEEHIPFTVHAGQYNTESIRQAIQYGALRISQGVHMLEDPDLLKEIIEKKIVVECCPASNLKLGTVESYSRHPIRKLFDMGVPVCVCTDRLRVSGSTLMEIYRDLERYLGFSPAEIYQMNQNAVNGAFLTQMEKDRLRFDLYEANRAIVDKE